MKTGKGMFMPDITVEMFRNASLEAIEELLAEGEVYDIDLKEELHREREQAYMQGYEYGAKRMREYMTEQLKVANLNCERAFSEGYKQAQFDLATDEVFTAIEHIGEYHEEN